MRVLSPGTPVVESAKTWRAGTVTAAHDGRYLVVFDNDPARQRYELGRSDLLCADDAYIAADGTRLPPMTYPEALRKVRRLLGETAGTAAGAEPLRGALTTFDRLATFAGATADFGPRPVAARTWPDSAVGMEGRPDPDTASGALRICLSALRIRGLRGMAAVQAVGVCSDLVALHADRLDGILPPAEEPELADNVIRFPRR